VAVHTLEASTDECYSDCPWRERGAYIGDAFVNLHIHRLASADLSVARRSLLIFAQAQFPDGQLPCCAPAWLDKPHEDFTLLWVLAVRDYWAHSGDAGFLLEVWPVIERIFASPSWKRGEDGLWDTTGQRLFIDWGVILAEREGAANAVINILRIAAHRAASAIAGVLAMEHCVRSHEDTAQRVEAAVIKALWNPGEKRFNASLGASSPALHANVLAMRYGIGDSLAIMDYLEPLLRSNLDNGLTCGETSGHAELYFFHYLLPALAMHGHGSLAVSLVREHYGFLKSLGYPTLPECFHQAEVGKGSCCHSWSGAAAVFATEYLLGLSPAFPGQSDVFRLSPADCGLSQAEGIYPHRAGPIRVRWIRQEGRFLARASLPAGVQLVPGPDVEIVADPCLVAAPAIGAD
jgi:hypothetical protein